MSRSSTRPTRGWPSMRCGRSPKSGAHREATLYHALARRGASGGRSLAELREAALEAAAASELPVWRRSGFWMTSLQGLELEQLDAGAQPSNPGAVPEVVARTLP